MLKLGKTEAKRRRGQQRMRELNGITDSMDMHLSKLPEIVGTKETGLLQSMGSQRFGHDLVIEHSENGTEYEIFFERGGLEVPKFSKASMYFYNNKSITNATFYEDAWPDVERLS